MIKWEDATSQEKLLRWDHVILVLSKLTSHQRKEHFDMGEWGRKTECGTVACAAGFCGLNPWFRHRGFVLKFYPIQHHYDEKPFYRLRTPDGEDIGARCIEFFGEEGSEIFFTPLARSVNDVIKEVKGYIKMLQEDLSNLPLV